jgi:hypothetical protein
MTEGFSDAVARFGGEVDDAVSRARRAAAEAREQTARFRREAAGQAEPAPKSPPVPPSGDDDDDFSQEQIMTQI